MSIALSWPICDRPSEKVAKVGKRFLELALYFIYAMSYEPLSKLDSPYNGSDMARAQRKRLFAKRQFNVSVYYSVARLPFYIQSVVSKYVSLAVSCFRL